MEYDPLALVMGMIAFWSVCCLLVMLANAFRVRLPMVRALLESVGLVLWIVLVVYAMSVLFRDMSFSRFLMLAFTAGFMLLVIKFFGRVDLYGDAPNDG